MNKKTSFFIIFTALTFPVAVFAFSAGNVPNSVTTLTINQLIDIMFSVIWPIAVAIIIFSGVVVGFMFMSAAGDPKKIEQARLAAIGVVLVTVVILLAFSIVFIVRNTLGNDI